MKQLLYVSLSIVLGISSAFVIVEGLLRLNKNYSFDAMVYSKDFGPKELKGVFRNSKELGYEFTPNANKEINSSGMRDKEYPLLKQPGTYRILLLGDSITEGAVWAEQLEGLLNRHGKYEILNCAVRGWGIYQFYAYMKYKALKFDPDLILIGLCLHDIPANNSTDLLRFDARSNMMMAYKPNGFNLRLTLRINPFLFERSYLYRFIVLNYLSRKNNTDKEAESAVEKLEFIKKLCSNRVLCIVFPYLEPLGNYTKRDEEDYSTTVSALNSANIEYLDLTSYFNKYGERIREFRHSENDKIHFNGEANRLESKVIYEWLVKEIDLESKNAKP